MVVRQFMLPSDSLSNIVSLLSLVTHMRPDVSEKDMLDVDTVTHARVGEHTDVRAHTHRHLINPQSTFGFVLFGPSGLH